MIPPKAGQFSRPDDADMRRYNDITEAHSAKLQKEFAGREFVFMLNKDDKASNSNLREEDQVKIRSDSDVKAGTVGRILGLNTTSLNQILILFETENNDKGSIWIRAADTPFLQGTKPTKLTDSIATAAWIEQNFLRVAEYIEAPALSKEEVVLPEAKEGLVLTPPPETGEPSELKNAPQPVINNLKALAEPARVSPGGEVRLLLSFTVVAEGMPKAEVEEKRTLEFNGSALPQFPVTRKVARPAGKHTSTYRQKIPKSAKPGIYLFRGEACIQNACNSHSAEFELLP